MSIVNLEHNADHPKDLIVSKLEYLCKKIFCKYTYEDKFFKLRNEVINEKAIINLFFENIKIKSYLQNTDSSFLTIMKEKIIYADDLNTYSLQA